jgi:hypothetical protein
MKRILLSIIVAFLSFAQSYAQTLSYSDSWDKEGFNLKSRNTQEVTINYSVNKFTLEDIAIRGESMKHISLAGHFLPGDEGMPDLPGSGRYIAIPQGATPVLHILSARKEIYRDINIAPAPRIPKDNENGPLVYNKNLQVYSMDAFYPAEPVKLSKLTRVRGVDAVILGITPFQYNPVTKELIVLRDLVVEVEFSGGNGQFGDERLRSRWWDPLLSDLFLNYDQLPKVDYLSRQLAVSSRQEKGTRATGYEYLIICPDDPVFISWADSIKNFRTMQGIYTGVVTTAEIGANTVGYIESYVNNAYYTWDIPPAAVLLLGDYGTSGSTIVAPIWGSYCVSDHLYADVDNDDEEEIIFARMTARNEAELQVMVRKALDYETNPPTNPDFYNHPVTALGWQTERWFQICSEVVGGYFRNVKGKDPVRINAVYGGDPDVDPWSTATNSTAVLSEFGPDGLGYIPATPSELGGFKGGTPAQINEALNSGAFLLQHRDHGNETGWGEPSYNNDDIPGLTNTDLSFIFSINCLTGKYNDGQECFAEKFHRYTYNGHPAGALGLLAASETSYSFVNDVYIWGVFDNMFPDFMPDFGSTPQSRGMLPAFGNAAGKFFLKYSSWPYNIDNKEVTYNLFHMHGDAFTCLYSEVPQELVVVHNPVQLAGLQTFTIQADEGSLIAFSVNGELIGIGTGTGVSEDIPIVAQNPPDFIDIVITKPNYYRYHSSVQVIPPSGPFVVTDSYIINDASGNSNGKLDYGETVSLDMTLKNLGSENAQNVSVSISSEDTYVSILDGTTQAGTILPDETTLVVGAFSVRADENVPNGHSIRINMQATDGDSVWNSSFFIKAFAPILEYSDFSVSDINGNNNGRPDAGETVDVTVSVKNKGGASAYNVYGLLGSSDPYIQVISDSVMFGEVPQNSTVSQTFQVSSVVITPPGHEADFGVTFSGNMGIVTDGEFSFPVGLFPILVLDLDGNHSSGNKIKDAIDDWRVFAEYSQEIPDDISEYRTIFLCLGTYDVNYILRNNEAGQFVDFLNNGGNLYLEGGDTWYYDQIYFPSSLHPMFKILGTSDGHADLSTLNGVPGTMTANLSYYYNGDNDYIDQISPLSPAYTIFNNTTPAYHAAVAYDAGTYKTIGSSFEFGGLTDNLNNTRKNLMLKYLTFFGMEPISEIPETPAGNTVVCSNSSSSVYSTQPVPGALYYIWELNPPFAGTVEGWSNEVTVNWSSGYTGDANIRVSGMNQSGLGPISSSLLIKLYAVPTAELAFSNSTICAGDTTYMSASLTGEEPWHMVVSFGGFEVTLNPNKPNFDGIVVNPTESIEVLILSLSDATGCENTDFTPMMINVLPIPSSPAKPAGPEYVDLYSASQSQYSTTGSADADSYEWNLTPPEAGTLTASESGLDCTVDWLATFTGQAELEVKGFNNCGEGEYSELLAVNVANTFGIGENGSGIGIEIYPNPNNGNFQVDLSSEHSTKTIIKVLTPMGEPAWGPVEVDVNRKLNLPIKASTLANGIYLIQFETTRGISYKKIIIKK